MSDGADRDTLVATLKWHASTALGRKDARAFGRFLDRLEPAQHRLPFGHPPPPT